MKKVFLFTMLIVTCTLMQVNVIYAQNPGDRAQKLRGTWWSGIYPDLLDDRMLSLKTLDGFGVGFSNGASLSAQHFAPVPLFSNLPGADAAFPANNDDTILQQILKIKNAGYRVKAYLNCENFVGTNQDHLVEFSDSWKNWCDTNPVAQAFINSQSYHTQAGYPDRKYMFCYAEFVIKYYSEQYGQYFDAWIFDSAKEMVAQGDNATSGNVADQRIYEAFANAARAGNNDIAVSFNNGRSTVNYDSYPFAHATRFDDFTFGHAFGGNNNHAEKVNGNQFNLNYQHIERMTETNGYVHDGGNWTWDDNIVGNFHSKVSTTAWKYGPVQAWEQDDFNQWNAEALLAGGMMTWDGSYDRAETAYYEWVYVMFKALDDYLYERGISINGSSSNGDNLALTGTASQSSTAHGGVASRAIDNNTSGVWSQGSVTHTASETNPWWEVDLGAEYSIGDINVFGRTDACCAGRLSNFTVYVYDADDNEVYSETFTTHPAPSVTSNAGDVIGQRVRIELNGTNALSLAEVEVYGVESAGSVVQITKRNAPGYAIDGGNGSANGQNVYLWSSNANNANQQWIEIDRGGGYYSYQKQGTNHCIDGGASGANNQNIYLWTCGENNQNQHWRKVDVGSGYYRLEKRNAPGFSMNGGGGGANEQNISLWNSSSTSQNLHWEIRAVNTAKKTSAKIAKATVTDKVIMYPNPVESILTIQGAANSSINIYNTNGQKLLTKDVVSDTEALDISSFSTGIYYAQVMGLQGVSVIKIVKE